MSIDKTPAEGFDQGLILDGDAPERLLPDSHINMRFNKPTGPE